MRYFIFFFLLSVNMSAQQQIIDTFYYIGAPGAIRSNSTSTTPGSVYEFIYCTVNVPDSLIIEMCDTKLGFYPGEHYLGGNPGYREYLYENNILKLITTGAYTPWDVYHAGSGCYDPSGTYKVTVTVPEGCCNIKWTIKGNDHHQTVYYLRVTEKFKGHPIVVDTMRTYSCIGAYNKYEYFNCERFLVMYADSSIQDDPLVTNPKCINKGSIVFRNYPEYSMYSLDTGQYEITIENSVCSKTWTYNLTNDYPCEVYAPNIFSPNDDGLNDVFGIYIDKPLYYDLYIYDRWGSLVFNKTINSNTTDLEGWDGTSRSKDCSEGVYVWRAVIYYNKSTLPVHGDITLIR